MKKSLTSKQQLDMLTAVQQICMNSTRKPFPANGFPFLKEKSDDERRMETGRRKAELGIRES